MSTRQVEPTGATGRGFALGLGVIAALGYAIRVWFIARYTDRKGILGLRGDAFLYYSSAEALHDGHGFVKLIDSLVYQQPVPDASHPPGFTVFLAGIRFLGIDTPGAQRYAVALLGVATIVVTGIIAKELLGHRAGLIAAALCAVYPQIWISDGLLMPETLFVFGLALGTLGIYRFRRKGTLTTLALAGVGYTLASSARPESVLLFILVIVPAVIGRSPRDWRRWTGQLAFAAVPFIVVFAPWSVYSTSRIHHPVLLTTGFGQTLLQSNCDKTFHGPDIGYFSIKCMTAAHPPVAPGERLPNQAVADSYYRRKAIDYAKAHKSDIPKVVLAREGRLWGVFRPIQQAHFDHFVEARGPLGLTLFAWYCYVALAVAALVGAVVWRRRGLALYPLVAEIGITAFAAALTYGNTRYRAGVELCIVLFAAAAIDALIGRIGHRRPGPTDDEPSAETPQAQDDAETAVDPVAGTAPA